MSEGFTIPLTYIDNSDVVLKNLGAISEATTKISNQTRKLAEEQRQAELERSRAYIAEQRKKAKEYHLGFSGSDQHKDMFDKALKANLEALSRFEREFIKTTAAVTQFNREIYQSTIHNKAQLKELTSVEDAMLRQFSAYTNAKGALQAFNLEMYEETKKAQLSLDTKKRRVDLVDKMRRADLEATKQAEMLKDAEYQATLILREKNKATEAAITEAERLRIKYEDLRKSAAAFAAGPTPDLVPGTKPVTFKTKGGVQGAPTRADVALQEQFTKLNEKILIQQWRLTDAAQRRIKVLNDLQSEEKKLNAVNDLKRKLNEQIATQEARLEPAMQSKINKLARLASKEKELMAASDMKRKLNEQLKTQEARMDELMQRKIQKLAEMQSQERAANSGRELTRKLNEQLAIQEARMTDLAQKKLREIANLASEEKRLNSTYELKRKLNEQITSQNARMSSDAQQQIQTLADLVSREKRVNAERELKRKLAEQIKTQEARLTQEAQNQIRLLDDLTSKERALNASRTLRNKLSEQLKTQEARLSYFAQSQIQSIADLVSKEKVMNAGREVRRNLAEKVATQEARMAQHIQVEAQNLADLISKEKVMNAEREVKRKLAEQLATLEARLSNSSREQINTISTLTSAEKVRNAGLTEQLKLQEKLASLQARKALRGSDEYRQVQQLTLEERKHNALLNEKEKLEMRRAILLHRSSSEMKALITEVRKLEAAERAAGAAFGDFGTRLTGVNQLTASMRAGMTAVGAQFGIYTSGTILAAAATYGFVKAVKDAIKTGMDFQTELARANAVMGINESQFQLLTRASIDLAASSRYTVTEVASAFREMGMAGIGFQESMAGIKAVLSLASIGNMDFARATDIATNVTFGFNMATSELTHVVDVMAKTVTSSNQDIEQLGNTMSYAAPIASSFGISLELTAAMTEVLANAGIKASRAGTALRRTFTALFSDSENVNKQLGELGVKVNLLAADMDKELLRVLKALNTATLGATTNVDNLTKAVGLYAAPGFLKLVAAADKSATSLEEIYKKSKDVEGAAYDMQKAIENTLAVDMNVLISAIQAVQAQFFELYQGGLRDFVQGISSFIQGLANNKEIIKEVAADIERLVKIISTMLASLAGIGALFGAFSILGKIGASLKALFTGVGAAGAAVKGIAKVGVAIKALTGVGVVTGLAASAYQIYEAFNKLSKVEPVPTGVIRSFQEAKIALSGDIPALLLPETEGIAVRTAQQKASNNMLQEQQRLKLKEIEKNEQILAQLIELQRRGELVSAEGRNQAMSIDLVTRLIKEGRAEVAKLNEGIKEGAVEYTILMDKLQRQALTQIEVRKLTIPVDIEETQKEIERLERIYFSAHEAIYKAGEERTLSMTRFILAHLESVVQSLPGLQKRAWDVNYLKQVAPEAYEALLALEDYRAKLQELTKEQMQLENSTEVLVEEMRKMDEAILRIKRAQSSDKAREARDKELSIVRSLIDSEKAYMRELEKSKMTLAERVAELVSFRREFEATRNSVIKYADAAKGMRQEIMLLEFQLERNGQLYDEESRRLDFLRKQMEVYDGWVQFLGQNTARYNETLEELIKLQEKYGEEAKKAMSSLASIYDALGAKMQALAIRRREELKSASDSEKGLLKLKNAVEDLDRAMQAAVEKQQFYDYMRDLVLGTDEFSLMARDAAISAGEFSSVLESYDASPVITEVNAIKDGTISALDEMTTQFMAFSDYVSEGVGAAFRAIQESSVDVREAVIFALEGVPDLVSEITGSIIELTEAIQDLRDLSSPGSLIHIAEFPDSLLSELETRMEKAGDLKIDSEVKIDMETWRKNVDDITYELRKKLLNAGIPEEFSFLLAEAMVKGFKPAWHELFGDGSIKIGFELEGDFDILEVLGKDYPFEIKLVAPGEAMIKRVVLDASQQMQEVTARSVGSSFDLVMQELKEQFPGLMRDPALSNAIASMVSIGFDDGLSFVLRGEEFGEGPTYGIKIVLDDPQGVFSDDGLTEVLDQLGVRGVELGVAVEVSPASGIITFTKLTEQVTEQTEALPELEAGWRRIRSSDPELNRMLNDRAAATEVLTSATGDLAYASDRAAVAAGRQVEMSARVIESQNRLRASTLAVREASPDQGEQLSAWDSTNARLERAVELQRILNNELLAFRSQYDSLSENEKSYLKLLQQQEQQNRQLIAQSRESLDFHSARSIALGQETKIRKLATSEVEVYKEKYNELYAAQMKHARLSVELAQAYEANAINLKQLNKLLKESAYEVVAANGKWSEYWVSLKRGMQSIADIGIDVADTIRNALIDGLVEGKMALEDFGKFFKRKLAEWAVNTIYINVIGMFTGAQQQMSALTGGGVGAIGQAANQQGGIMGVLSRISANLTANSIGEGVAQGLGNLGGIFGKSPSPVGPYTQGQSYSPWLANSMASLSAVPNWALGAGGIGGTVLGSALFGSQGYGQIGSALGSAAGSVMGPMIGAAIAGGPLGVGIATIASIAGGLLGGTGGGFLGSMFGGGKEDASTITLNVTDGYMGVAGATGALGNNAGPVYEAVAQANAYFDEVAEALGGAAWEARRSYTHPGQALDESNLEKWIGDLTKEIVQRMIDATKMDAVMHSGGGVLAEMMEHFFSTVSDDPKAVVAAIEAARGLNELLMNAVKEMFDFESDPVFTEANQSARIIWNLAQTMGKAGEAMDQTVTRLISNINLATQAFDLIGQPLTDIALSEADLTRTIALTREVEVQVETAALEQKITDQISDSASVSAQIMQDSIAQTLVDAYNDSLSGWGPGAQVLDPDWGRAIFGPMYGNIQNEVEEILRSSEKAGESVEVTKTRVEKQIETYYETIALTEAEIAEALARKRAEIGEKLAEYAGGAESLQAGMSSYYEAFFSEAERSAKALERAMSQANDALDDLGIAMPENKAQFRDLIEALDLTTESGQKTFGTLMSMIEVFKLIYDAAVDVNDAFSLIRQSLNELADAIDPVALKAGDHTDAKNALTSAGYSGDFDSASIAAFIRAMADAEDAGGEAAEEILRFSDAIKAMVDEAKAIDDQRYELEARLANLLGNELEVLTRAREQELAATYEVNKALLMYIWALEDAQKAANDAFAALETAINAQKDSIQELYDTQMEALEKQRGEVQEYYDTQMEALQTWYDAERESLQKAHDEKMELYNEELEAARKVVSDLSGIVSSLENAISSLKEQIKDEDLTDFWRGVNDLRYWQNSGTLPTQKELDEAIKNVTSLSTSQFSSKEEYDYALNMALAALEGLEAQISPELEAAEATVKRLEELIELENEQFEIEMKALEDSYNKQKEALETWYEAQIESIEQQTEVLEEWYKSEIDALDLQLETAREQLDATLNMHKTVLSIEEAQQEFNRALMELTAVMSAQTPYTSSAQEQSAISSIAIEEALMEQYTAADEYYAKSLAYNDDAQDSYAELSAKLEEIANQVAGLRSENAAYQSRIANASEKAYVIQRTWNYDGLPPTREAESIEAL